MSIVCFYWSCAKPGGLLLFPPVRAHLLTTSSKQALYRSLPAKAESSFTPLLLLSTQSRLCGDPFRRWYFLWKPCAHLRAKSRRFAAVALRNTPAGAVRGGCGCCGSLQTMPQHLRVLLPSSAQTAIPCDERSEAGVDILYPCYRLPAETCHRQLCRRDGQCARTVHFLFYERETEKRKRGK